MTDEFPEPHMDSVARAMIEDDIVRPATPSDEEIAAASEQGFFAQGFQDDEPPRIKPADERLTEVRGAVATSSNVAGVVERLRDGTVWLDGDIASIVNEAETDARMSEAADLIEALACDRQGMREDADRFRALMRCGRIKMQGSSGVDPLTGERNGNNVHFGAEFWPEPIEPEWEETYRVGTTWGRACLRALADAIIEQEAARAASLPEEAADHG